jgi:threonine dehydrogenase-like Zn-dependent dehydrogenase
VHPRFCQLATSSRFALDGLITHRFMPELAEEAYRAADTRDGNVLGVVFDWR